MGAETFPFGAVCVGPVQANATTEENTAPISMQMKNCKNERIREATIQLELYQAVDYGATSRNLILNAAHIRCCIQN